MVEVLPKCLETLGLENGRMGVLRTRSTSLGVETSEVFPSIGMGEEWWNIKNSNSSFESASVCIWKFEAKFNVVVPYSLAEISFGTNTLKWKQDTAATNHHVFFLEIPSPVQNGKEYLNNKSKDMIGCSNHTPVIQDHEGISKHQKHIEIYWGFRTLFVPYFFAEDAQHSKRQLNFGVFQPVELVLQCVNIVNMCTYSYYAILCHVML